MMCMSLSLSLHECLSMNLEVYHTHTQPSAVGLRCLSKSKVTEFIFVISHINKVT